MNTVRKIIDEIHNLPKCRRERYLILSATSKTSYVTPISFAIAQWTVTNFVVAV